MWDVQYRVVISQSFPKLNSTLIRSAKPPKLLQPTNDALGLPDVDWGQRRPVSPSFPGENRNLVCIDRAERSAPDIPALSVEGHFAEVSPTSLPHSTGNPKPTFLAQLKMYGLSDAPHDIIRTLSETSKDLVIDPDLFSAYGAGFALLLQADNWTPLSPHAENPAP